LFNKTCCFLSGLNIFTIICLNINYYISFNLDLCLVILHPIS
jgi:hypothetical protein